MRELLAELRPSAAVRSFMQEVAPRIQDMSQDIGIGKRALVNQVLLHVPYHDEQELTDEPSAVADTILEKAAIIGVDFKGYYDSLHDASDIAQLGTNARVVGKKVLQLETDDGNATPIRFGEVSPETAATINGRLHYIRNSRNDTLLNYGLFIGSANSPYATVSFSRCNRNYQVDTLNTAAGLTLDTAQALSMTRAFALDGAPKNSMSKLFHLSVEHIKHNFHDYAAVVTALNPYLGFEGGVFTGASFEPYALSPLEYWYDKDGFYVPRKMGVHAQKQPTPPILWLARGLDKHTALAVDTLAKKAAPVQIDPALYKKG